MVLGVVQNFTAIGSTTLHGIFHIYLYVRTIVAGWVNRYFWYRKIIENFEKMNLIKIRKD